MTDIEFCTDVRVELIQNMGGDASVVGAARVSTIGEGSLEDFCTDPEERRGLINFLMANRHGTPFEHNAMTFFIEAPIFVFREFHRHRIGWSYNEISGRYSELPPRYYIPNQDRAVKQEGKPGHYIYVPDDYLNDEAGFRMRSTSRDADHRYREMLRMGVAREVARMVLPVNTMTAMYATCNARSMMAFLSLRTKHEESKFPSYPMREIEMVAEKMEDFFSDLFPITWECFEKNGRVSP